MQNNTVNSIRIIPRAADFLDRKLGVRGEVFFDQTSNTLRLYDGVVTGGIQLAKADLTNIANAAFLAKANAAGFSGGVQAGVAGRLAYYPSTGSQVNDLAEVYWHTHDSASMLHVEGLLEVSGQKNKIRFHWDSLADLTSEVPAATWHGMIAHAHDTGKLYYAHAGAWVPVASEASLPNSFSTVAVAGQVDIVADSVADTLTFAAGNNITITTNVNTDTITINSTASTGNITFVGNTIDSTDSTAITVTPSVVFDSDITVGTDIVFPDGSRQSTSAVGIPGPKGDQGEPGATGAGTGDVISAGGGYVDNRIVRYDGTTGTIIQVSSASISDAGLLTATSFSGDGSLITALNATQLTSGTIPDARFPATLPASSGVNLTALNATQLTSGTVPVLRLGSSGTRDNTTYLRGDNTWATVAGGSSSDSFATIAVAGQSSVVADSATDTLTLVAGSNITITTDASTDTITITAAGGGTASDSFATIAVAGQSSVLADSSTDTLTLAAGTGISITTDAGTDTVTITNTVTAGATAFTGLSDAAGLTIDQFYLPAITRLNVTNSGASAYLFDQYSGNNPALYVISGTTIAFNLNVSGHPFLLQDNTLTNITAGLVHVTTAGVVTTGASAQGKVSGTLYWKIPASLGGVNYAYQCSAHAPMVGTITIKGIASI